MKKTIIANWGHALQGKSETVKGIAKKILNDYPEAISNPIQINYSGDIKVVITIGKLKIGIESQGDPNSRLFSSLKEFSELKCDMIICATRTSGKTVHAVRKLSQSDNYELIWVTNYRSSSFNHDNLNELSVNHIYELIQKILTN